MPWSNAPKTAEEALMSENILPLLPELKALRLRVINGQHHNADLIFALA